MRRFLTATAMLILGGIAASAQSMDDLNLQFHGYATQGFLYTTNNNILTTNSSTGSPAWTEAVINIGAQPTPRLRVAVQARYELLGLYSNEISIDFAAVDYKVNDRFGVRFGKVKTPSGLFNEIQDIDPSYMWSLLPQSVYPISSRNAQLSHYGGVVYGTVHLSDLGKLEYRAWGGEAVLASNDGYFTDLKEAGIALPDGLKGVQSGAALHWKTPLPGLTIGASDILEGAQSSPMTAGNGSYTGTLSVGRFNRPDYFAEYDRGRLMVAGEFVRTGSTSTTQLTGLPSVVTPFDKRGYYAMGAYKFGEKVSAGAYYSQYVDKSVAPGPTRFQNDLALSGRYDFNQYLYAKAEEHFLDGTSILYDTSLNPNGLAPKTKMTILKIGVSF